MPATTMLFIITKLLVLVEARFLATRMVVVQFPSAHESNMGANTGIPLDSKS